MSNNKKISGLLPLAPRILDNVTGFATYIDIGEGESINVKVSGQEIIDGIYKISSTSEIDEVDYTSSVQAYSGSNPNNFQIKFTTYGKEPCWIIDGKGNFIPSLVDDSSEHQIGSETSKVRKIFLIDESGISMGSDADNSEGSLTSISLKNEPEVPYFTIYRPGDLALGKGEYSSSLMSKLSSNMEGASFENGTLTLPAFPEPPEPLVYTGEEPIVVDKTKISFSGLVLTPEERDNIKTNTAKAGFPGFGTDENKALDGSYAAAIEANTAKVGITPGQAENIQTNNAKVSANNATVEIKTGQGLEGGDSFTLNQPGDKEITISLTTPINDGKLNLTAGEGIEFTGNTTFSANQSSDTELTISAKTSNTGVVIDLEGIKGSEKKADLNKEKQEIIGAAGSYTAKGEIKNGQPVMYSYTGGDIKVMSPPSLPIEIQKAGIALNDASDGDSVKVLNKGFATIRRDTIFLSNTEEVVMTNNTSLEDYKGEFKNLTNSTTLKDAPTSSTSTNYATNQRAFIVFDIGENHHKAGHYIRMKFNSFGFEGFATSEAYDALCVQVSNDNETWKNVCFNWMITLKNQDFPFGYNGGLEFLKSSGPTAGASIFSGYGSLIPDNMDDANTNNQNYKDWTGEFPKNDIKDTFYNLTGEPQVWSSDNQITQSTMGNPEDPVKWRYVRFIFQSDYAVGREGFDITLEPSSPYVEAIEPVAEGALLYIDPNDCSKVVTGLNDSISTVVGVATYSDSSNNSVFARVFQQEK